MTIQPSGLDFAPAVAYFSGGFYTESIAVADVNGDGKLDLLTADCQEGLCNANAAGVLLGNGDGTFEAAQSYASRGLNVAFSIAVADVNGDGRLDLLVANECSAPFIGICTASVGVLLGNGDGTFQSAVNYASGTQGATSVTVADVNNDGKPDVIVSGGSVSVLIGNGDGTFQTAVAYSSGGGDTASSVAVADVNGDGRPDLVVANLCSSSDCSTGIGNLGVLLGNGDGTFQAAVTYDLSGSAASVAVADLNGDGESDVVVVGCATYVNYYCSGNGIVDVLLGNGDGTFRAAVTYDAGGQYGATSVAIADLNRDGKSDLLVSNQCSSSGCTNGSVGVLLGNGDGTFQATTAYDSSGADATSVAAADVNGDGKPDLVVSNLCNVAAFGGCDWGGLVDVFVNESTEATTTGLVSSLNPSYFGQTVTFTASVVPQGSGTPTGTATFFDGAVSLGASTLDSGGIAAINVPGLAAGTHSISAVYGGDTNFASSTSPVVPQVVQVDTVPPTITVSANPTTLWPPNGRMVCVTISGTITDAGSGVNATTAAYAVTDEYGKIQPSGAITVGSGGGYSFSIFLQASRAGSDKDGRQYTVTISAKDNAGNTGSASTLVSVPHDQGD